MRLHGIPFEATDWSTISASEHPGILGVALWRTQQFGEVRVRMVVGVTETTLATLGPGEFFGEMAIFDDGPRSADVLTNQDSVLLKISSDAFDKLLKNAPQLAAPFLFGIGKTLAARIRADNKRFRDSIAFSRAANK